MCVQDREITRAASVNKRAFNFKVAFHSWEQNFQSKDRPSFLGLEFIAQLLSPENYRRNQILFSFDVVALGGYRTTL